MLSAISGRGASASSWWCSPIRGWPAWWAILDAARVARDRGLVRHLALSSHHRPLIPELAAGSDFDVLHFRYNAAHLGAERDMFPPLCAGDRPGMVAYTATSWGQLLKRGKLPAGGRVPII
jgi:aryl-alcohol dehydrogenase-like predicted oxidoreductase